MRLPWDVIPFLFRQPKTKCGQLSQYISNKTTNDAISDQSDPNQKDVNTTSKRHNAPTSQLFVFLFDKRRFVANTFILNVNFLIVTNLILIDLEEKCVKLIFFASFTIFHCLYHSRGIVFRFYFFSKSAFRLANGLYVAES